MNHPDLNQLAKEMKTLQLTLKKKWFELILSGEKKEEYREIKLHWILRLVNVYYGVAPSKRESEIIQGILDNKDIYTSKICPKITRNRLHNFEVIEFTNGYGKDKPTATFECLGITIGKGDTDLGAPKEDVFIIKLGKEISRKNITNEKESN